MKLGVYSFLDTQTGIFSLPFYQPHPALARRAASELVSDLNTTIGRHPGSFALYLLGDYDDNTGQFSGSAPIMICPCSALLPPPVATGDLVDLAAE